MHTVKKAQNGGLKKFLAGVKKIMGGRCKGVKAILSMYKQKQIFSRDGSSKKFHRISSSPQLTLPNDNYDAPKDVCRKRNSFDRPLQT